MFKSTNNYSDHNVFSLSVSKLFILNIKNVYSTWATRLVIFLSPIFVVFSLSVLFPIQLFVAAGQVFTVPLSAGIVYGMAYFPMKRSTIDNNISITSLNKIQVYGTILLTMLFVTFISEITFWVSLIFFEKIGIAGTTSILNIITKDKNFEVNWLKVEWGIVFYYWIMSTTLMFLTSFFVRGFTKSINWYYSILFIYVMFLISFGKLLEGESLKVENGDLVIHNNVNFIYIVSSFVPQSHLDLFMTKSMNTGIINSVDGTTYHGLNLVKTFSWSTDWQWNYSLLYPWAFLLVIIIACSITL